VRSIEIDEDQSNMDDLKSMRSYKSKGSFRSEVKLDSSKNYDDEDPDVSHRANRINIGGGAVS